MAQIIEMPGAEVRTKALTWPERADRAIVTDPATYQAAAELLLGIKALRQEIAATFDPHVAAAHAAHKALLAEKAKAEQPLALAERTIKDRLSAYDREQERRRREEERRQQDEARRAEEARILDQAAAMEREGRAFGDDALVAEAEALLETPVAPPPIAPVAKATPQVAGITHRSTWSATVTNLLELVRFVAANPSHLNLLQANVPALNAQARSLKGALAIPGVRAMETRDVAAGGRR